MEPRPATGGEPGALTDTERQALVTDNVGLARHLAMRYLHRGCDLDDLVGIAQVGLVAASRRYDPARGVPFGAYAAQVILGELRTWFRDQSRLVNVPRRAVELARRAQLTTDALTADLGRSPTVAETAAALDVDVDTLLGALEAAAASRVEPLEPDRDPTTGDRFEDRVDVADLLDRLPERDRQVVKLRFWEDLSQSEIAARVGVSQMQISRILRRVLTTLADSTTDQDP